MKAKCNICGKINEVKEITELCSNCQGNLHPVKEDYGKSEQRPETIKKRSVSYL